MATYIQNVDGSIEFIADKKNNDWQEVSKVTFPDVKFFKITETNEGGYCPICNALISKKNFNKHLKKHEQKRTASNSVITQKSNEKEKIYCPKCNVLLNKKNLERHLIKVHSTTNTTPTKTVSNNIANTKPKIQVCKKNKTVSNNRSSKKVYGSNIEFDDTYYANKGDYQFRDDGRFGSTPLYDDYDN